VTVGGKPAQTTSSNTFSAQAPVGSGTTDVAVVATDPAGNVRTNTYRVTESSAGGTYTYDSNGNLSSKTEGPDTWGYEWNANNELTRVTKNTIEQARFSYDPLGRRVEKVAGSVTTAYAYDGEGILRQVRGAEILKYVHGPDIDEPLSVEDGATTSFFHSDGLGSVVQVTSLSGAVTLTRRYDAWGNLEAGANDSGFAFTGREWDSEIGLYYYRARYYDSRLGRFISEDPLGFWDGTNVFAYVHSRAPNGSDPSGLAEQCGCDRLQDQSGQSKSGWNAGVCCKDGHFVICVNNASWKKFGPRQRKCILEHEESHMSEMKFLGQGCNDAPCTLQPIPYDVPNDPDGYDRVYWMSECAGYLREVACLKGSNEWNPIDKGPAYKVAMGKMEKVCAYARKLRYGK